MANRNSALDTSKNASGEGEVNTCIESVVRGSTSEQGDWCASEGICEEAKPYFVGMFDIMGFKQLVQNPMSGLTTKKHIEKIHRTMLTDFVDIGNFIKLKVTSPGLSVQSKSFRTIAIPDKYSKGHEDIQYYSKCIDSIIGSMYFFSDTIFFYVEAADSKASQLTQLHAMCDVSNSLIVLSNLYPREIDRFQIVMRGAIAYGLACMDTKKVYCGDPIIDAYELSEGQTLDGCSLTWLCKGKSHRLGIRGSKEVDRLQCPIIQYIPYH